MLDELNEGLNHQDPGIDSPEALDPNNIDEEVNAVLDEIKSGGKDLQTEIKNNLSSKQSLLEVLSNYFPNASKAVRVTLVALLMAASPFNVNAQEGSLKNQQNLNKLDKSQGQNKDQVSYDYEVVFDPQERANLMAQGVKKETAEKYLRVFKELGQIRPPGEIESYGPGDTMPSKLVARVLTEPMITLESIRMLKGMAPDDAAEFLLSRALEIRIKDGWSQGDRIVPPTKEQSKSLNDAVKTLAKYDSALYGLSPISNRMKSAMCTYAEFFMDEKYTPSEVNSYVKALAGNNKFFKSDGKLNATGAEIIIRCMKEKVPVENVNEYANQFSAKKGTRSK